MLRTAAKLLSYLLHPVLMPTYAVVLIFRVSSYYSTIVSTELKEKIFLIVGIDTLLIPLAIVYLMYLRRTIKSFEMESREERIAPFLITSICYFSAYYMLRFLPLPKVFNLLLLGAAVAITITSMITIKWRISIHMVGIGGMVGGLISISQYLSVDFANAIFILMIAAGLLGTARLIVSRHSHKQIYAGFLLGFLCEFFILWI
jgi:hypothetical protein